MKKVREEARDVKVGGEYDVIVVGGGPAGIAASIAAAREGAHTLLIERHGFLGGMGTAGMVSSFCGFYTTGQQKMMIVGGIAATLLEKLREWNGVSEKGVSKVDPRIASLKFNPEVFKVVSEQIAVKNGVELLLHTMVTQVVWGKSKSKLAGVIVESKSGRSALLSKIVIDASGDGDVAAQAGVPFEYGDGKGSAQALTTIFRLINVEQQYLKDLSMPRVKEILLEAKKTGRYSFDRVDGIINPALPAGIVTVNISSIPHMNALDAFDLTRAELQGRTQAYEYVRAFRENLPGFERAEICSLAPQIGVRETRRIMGEYVLQEEDVLKGRKFEDRIALGAWPIEIHDPITRGVKWGFLEKEDDYYSIPIRCLIPQKIDNILIAGRCLSASHGAQASTRVIAPALAAGEAAGALAAQSLQSKTKVRKVPVEIVQNVLRQRGALLEL